MMKVSERGFFSFGGCGIAADKVFMCWMRKGVDVDHSVCVDLLRG